MRRAWIMGFVLVAVGCATPRPYAVSLAGALRPEAPLRLIDGMLADERVGFVAVDAAPNGLLLEVVNLSPSTIRIIWDEGSFVGPDGYSSRVVPGETRVLDVARSQPVTPIPPDARTQLWAMSSDEPRAGTQVGSSDDAEAICRGLLGEALRLVLPIEGTDWRREYTLRFVADSVSVVFPPDLVQSRHEESCRG